MKINNLLPEPLDVAKAIYRAASDRSKESTCRELVELTISSFGSLDILIHNAGWVGYQAIEEIEVDFIQRAIDRGQDLPKTSKSKPTPILVAIQYLSK